MSESLMVISFSLKGKVGSKPTSGTFNGDGAEEARGADNSEVLGSSPSPRISFLLFLFLVISLNESIQDIERKYTYASIECFYIQVVW